MIESYLYEMAPINPFAFTGACRGGCGKSRMKPSRWHHPCKFVANKRKSQIEIQLADGILC